MLRGLFRGIRNYGRDPYSGGSQRPPFSNWSRQGPSSYEPAAPQEGTHAGYYPPRQPVFPNQPQQQPGQYSNQPPPHYQPQHPQQPQYQRPQPAGGYSPNQYSPRSNFASRYQASAEKAAPSTRAFRKPVTSNSLSFQAKDGGRIRVSFDEKKTAGPLTLVLEDADRKFISYPLTTEAINVWLQNYTQARPCTLPEAGEVTAKVGTADNDTVLIQLANKENKTINVSLTLGQARLIEAFMKWTTE